MGLDVTGLGEVANLGNTIWTTIFGKKPTPEEKAKFDQILQERDAQRDGAKRDVMVAELNQGDLYTKRARPTIVYFGLAVIAINHVICPWVAKFIMIWRDVTVDLPQIDLPTEFWWAWGGVCSVYAIGRTAEKRGVKNQIISAITGN